MLVSVAPGNLNGLFFLAVAAFQNTPILHPLVLTLQFRSAHFLQADGAIRKNEPTLLILMMIRVSPHGVCFSKGNTHNDAIE